MSNSMETSADTTGGSARLGWSWGPSKGSELKAQGTHVQGIGKSRGAALHGGHLVILGWLSFEDLQKVPDSPVWLKSLGTANRKHARHKPFPVISDLKGMCQVDCCTHKSVQNGKLCFLLTSPWGVEMCVRGRVGGRQR